MLSAKSIYDFKVKRIDGSEITLDAYRGKVLMIVNTASKCGFTSQYKDLQEIYDKYSDKGFVILGFPANNFMNQEPGSNDEIMQFCQLNYGVSFPMFEKISVKGKNIHPLYKFLTDKETNPKFNGSISWNFNKFLISKEGKIIDRFGSNTNPIDKKVLAAIEEALK
jgi:glutathione peroxidase